MKFPIGLAIRDAREARGMSRYRLEKRSHVGGGYLTRVERGVHIPSLDLIQSIAKALKVEMWELVKNAQEIQKLPSRLEPDIKPSPIHCKRGHLWTTATTYNSLHGYRVCKVCRAMHMAAYYRRKKVAA